MNLDMKQFGLSIYFLAESDQKQKLYVKSRNCFIPSLNILKACGQNLTRELTQWKTILCVFLWDLTVLLESQRGVGFYG